MLRKDEGSHDAEPDLSQGSHYSKSPTKRTGLLVSFFSCIVYVHTVPI